MGTGTITTLAPEGIMGNFSCKCDVWSLGCVLFSLFCHTPVVVPKKGGGVGFILPYPFHAPNFEHYCTWSPKMRHAYLKQLAQGYDEKLVSGSAGVRDLMTQLLTFDEYSRPTMGEVLAHRWFASPSQHALSKVHAECLVQFRLSTALERAVLLDVAANLPVTKLRGLAKVFTEAD